MARDVRGQARILRARATPAARIAVERCALDLTAIPAADRRACRSDIVSVVEAEVDVALVAIRARQRRARAARVAEQMAGARTPTSSTTAHS